MTTLFRLLFSRNCLALLWLGIFLALAYAQIGRSGRSASAIPEKIAGAQAPVASAQPTSANRAQGPARKPIEHIRVGDRVLAENPEIPVEPPSEVNPATWRFLRLRAELRWPDGTIDDVNLETLQAPSWVDRFGAAVGAVVPIPLDLAEMGLPEDTKALVIANDRCPQLQDGPGRLVISTVNHLNSDVRELTVKDQDGCLHVLRPTGLHRFFRDSDRLWVATRDLRAGDELRSRLGPVIVNTNLQVAGVHRVFNMTVEGQHVYEVTGIGVVGHNNCPPAATAGKAGGPVSTASGLVTPNAASHFDEIARFRQRAGLPAFDPAVSATGTVARAVVEDGRAYQGLNTSLSANSIPARMEVVQQLQAKGYFKKVTNIGQAPMLAHAEAHALMRAVERTGATSITLYTDRVLCGACRQQLGLLADHLGVTELRVFELGNPTAIPIRARP